MIAMQLSQVYTGTEQACRVNGIRIIGHVLTCRIPLLHTVDGGLEEYHILRVRLQRLQMSFNAYKSIHNPGMRDEQMALCHWLCEQARMLNTKIMRCGCNQYEMIWDEVESSNSVGWDWFQAQHFMPILILTH